MRTRIRRAYCVPVLTLLIVLYTSLSAAWPTAGKCPSCGVMPSFQGLQALR